MVVPRGPSLCSSSPSSCLPISPDTVFSPLAILRDRHSWGGFHSRAGFLTVWGLGVQGHQGGGTSPGSLFACRTHIPATPSPLPLCVQGESSPASLPFPKWTPVLLGWGPTVTTSLNLDCIPRALSLSLKYSHPVARPSPRNLGQHNPVLGTKCTSKPLLHPSQHPSPHSASKPSANHPQPS